jgi:hypothetical protein
VSRRRRRKMLVGLSPNTGPPIKFNRLKYPPLALDLSTSTNAASYGDLSH